MKTRLAEAAAKRLDEHRSLQSGPLAAAQEGALGSADAWGHD
jgi:hypothetical protein